MFKEHPKGLRTLFFTEMWERFGFYTMMAILVLYMDLDFGWGDEIKGVIYGVFLLAVYVFPILGGYIADKWLGAKNTILMGAGVMTVGYASLTASSLDRLFFFYAGLVTIALGSGLFKANISVVVGNLYESGSKLKDTAYNIFYMGINIGALMAPLAATFLRNKYSFNACFAAASVGMLVSIAVLGLGKKTYEYAAKGSMLSQSQQSTGEESKPMSRTEEKMRIVSLIILFAIAFFFWMAFYQNGSALTLFAQRSTVHYPFLKAETYQFFNPFFIVLLTLILIVPLFNYLRKKKKEPSSAAKICTGMFVASVALLIMVAASLSGGNKDMNIMSPGWLISTYFVITIAELLVSPMGLSFTSKVAPPRLQGSMMGMWFGATGLGAMAAGIFTSFYSKIPHHLFFLILSASLFFAGLLVLAFMKKLKQFST
ncbi:peptide MFS transporter [bacterium]|nr:peptide MFS transporter [bacterium]